MRILLKLIGWICIFCIVVIGSVFTINIIIPSLSAPRASAPYLSFHLKPRNIGNIAFAPDGKQFLCAYYVKRFGEIKRWNISDGQELSSIKSKPTSFISDLSEDGRFYITSNEPNNKKGVNLYLNRISDQTTISKLPLNKSIGNFPRIVGNPPLAICRYAKKIPRKDLESNPLEVKRRHYVWNVSTKKFLQSNPPTITLFSLHDGTYFEGAYSTDGTKVLSLWPAYTREINGHNTTVVKSFIPWEYPEKENPKEAWLLNEINGSITKLPFPGNQQFANSGYFNFGWGNSALSPDQRSFAAVGLNDSRNGSVTSEKGDGTIWCYDLAHRQLLWKYYSGRVSSDFLHFSPDATMLAIGGADFDYRINGSGFLRILDSKSGALLHSYTEQTLWQQIRDRTRIAVLKAIDNNSYLKSRFPDIFHAINFPPAPGNSGHVKHIAWSPDSKLLAASYEDGSVKIWRVKE